MIIKKHGLEIKVPDNFIHTDWLSKDFPTWEDETFKVFDKYKGKVAWDLGAWIGLTAIYLSKRFETVIALEPDLVAYNAAVELLKFNNITNVKLFREAVSDIPRKLSICSAGDSMSALNDEGIDITCITVRELQELFGYPDFIKCDIEGAERFVANDLLDMGCPTFISFHGYDCNIDVKGIKVFKGDKEVIVKEAQEEDSLVSLLFI